MEIERMIEEFREQLSPSELVVAKPVFELDPASLDLRRSTLEEKDGFLRVRFVAREDRHCPFELHFGRGEQSDRFNFFIGLGADYANYEPIGSAEEAAELAEDVRNFLTSTVTVEGESTNDTVLKEEYVGSNLVVDGRPLKLTYAGGKTGLFAKRTKYHREHAPWLAQGS